MSKARTASNAWNAHQWRFPDRLVKQRLGVLLGVGAVLSLTWISVNLHTGHSTQKAALASAGPVHSAQPKSRLSVLDRHGNVLAHDVEAFDVFITPRLLVGPCAEDTPCIPDPQRHRHLSAIDAALEPDREAQARWRHRTGANARFSHRTQSMPLVSSVRPDVAEALRQLRVPGLSVRKSRVRHYPHGALFSHAVGFGQLSPERRGLEGLELVLDRALLCGSFTGTSSPAGRLNEPVLRTTLDLPVQRLARDLLDKAMQHAKAKAGAVVVMEVESGAVRALVSAPDFDPNFGTSFRQPLQWDRILNRAVASPMAAGQLLDPLLLTEAYERQAIVPTSDVRSDMEGLRVLASDPENQSMLLRALGGRYVLGPGLTQGFTPDWLGERVLLEIGYPPAALQARLTLLQVMSSYQAALTTTESRPHLIAETGASDCDPTDGAAPTRATLPRTHTAQSRNAVESWFQVSGRVGGMQALTQSNGFEAMQSGGALALLTLSPPERPQWLVGVILSPQEPAWTRSTFQRRAARLSTLLNRWTADAMNHPAPPL